LDAGSAGPYEVASGIWTPGGRCLRAETARASCLSQTEGAAPGAPTPGAKGGARQDRRRPRSLGVGGREREKTTQVHQAPGGEEAAAARGAAWCPRHLPRQTGRVGARRRGRPQLRPLRRRYESRRRNGRATDKVVTFNPNFTKAPNFRPNVRTEPKPRANKFRRILIRCITCHAGMCPDQFHAVGR